MGKSSPKPPATPDYTGAAVAQGAANLEAARQTAYMSNPNIYTPLGSQQVSWTRTPQFNEAEYNKAMQQYTQNQALGLDGGAQPDREMFTTYVEQPTIRQQLTPEAQQTLEAQQRVERALAGLGEQGVGRVSGVLGEQFAPNLPTMQASYGDFGKVGETPDIGGMGQALGYIPTEGLANMPVNAGMTAQNAILARVEPQLQAERAGLEQQLANQGIPRGSQAYQAAMMAQGQKENDLRSQAALQGINVDAAMRAQGFGERSSQLGFYNQALAQNQATAMQQYQAQLAAQTQRYNQAAAMAQFRNQARQQALQEAFALRSQPLNEIAGLMGGSQIAMPQFQGYTGAQVAAAPVFAAQQAAGNFAQQNYANQMAGYNAQMGLLGGLAGAAGTALGGPIGGAFASRLAGG